MMPSTYLPVYVYGTLSWTFRLIDWVGSGSFVLVQVGWDCLIPLLLCDLWSSPVGYVFCPLEKEEDLYQSLVTL